MLHLKEGSLLQGGRYRIDKVLGQGGFGITYLGVQMGLNRPVAIKEFYMKEYCERDAETSHVSLGTSGSRATVERFRHKFVKEAQTISALSHPNIIRIYDVFEENGTAYYVMEYHGHGSLSDLVKQQGGLGETPSIGYIREIGEALRYIHDRKINHLDVKPGNVLLDSEGRAVLIDFGMSKRYDAVGEQTSTTPVGISHGYAPLEQYKRGGVSTFSPATDIYSLGATFYKLLTGVTPPDASDLDESVLSSMLSVFSAPVRESIFQSMQLKRKDRPQSMDAFLSLLDFSSATPGAVGNGEITIIDIPEPSTPPSPEPPAPRIPEPSVPAPSPVSEPKPSSRKWLLPLALVLVVVLGIFGLNQLSGDDKEALLTDSLTRVDTVPAASPVVETSVQPAKTNENVVDTVPVRTPEKKETPKPVPSKVSAATGTINGHGYVDLGLSVKWATMNVGASSPGGYGSYFAWGEVRTKSEYTEENCLTWEKDLDDINGNSQYDAARYHWGGSWRLPTRNELQELIDKCSWSWIKENGHYGCKVVGPNGNSIFLPAAGYLLNSWTEFLGERLCYWSASCGKDANSPYQRDANKYACCLTFDMAYKKTFDNRSYVIWVTRDDGCSIRPVSD